MLHRFVWLAHSGLRRTREATNDRLDHAGSGMSEMTVAPVTGIPEKVLEDAIAVGPDLLKGGFGFGAENGRGVATCRTAW